MFLVISEAGVLLMRLGYCSALSETMSKCACAWRITSRTKSCFEDDKIMIEYIELNLAVLDLLVKPEETYCVDCCVLFVSVMYYLR